MESNFFEMLGVLVEAGAERDWLTDDEGMLFERFNPPAESLEADDEDDVESLQWSVYWGENGY